MHIPNDLHDVDEIFVIEEAAGFVEASAGLVGTCAAVSHQAPSPQVHLICQLCLSEAVVADVAAVVQP